MGKFDPQIPTSGDPELIELLASRGMGWKIFNISEHRPGSRPVPHAWRWEIDGRRRLMVFIGGAAPNVEFDPLNDQEAAEELADRLKADGIDVKAQDLTTAAGRRAFCEAADVALAARIDPEPAEPAASSTEAAFSPATPFDAATMGWAAVNATNVSHVTIERLSPPPDEGAAGAAASLPPEPSPAPAGVGAESTL